MYQEMLGLIRDYSDVRTQMNSQYEDPLSSHYDQKFNDVSKTDDQDNSFEDRDDSDTESECDRIVKEELQRKNTGG
jgi:hypothetical protein